MADENLSKSKLPAYHFHRFLDEAGDTTFYGKGKIPMIGTDGVSNYFLLGMLSVNQSLDEVRKSVSHYKIVSLMTPIYLIFQVLKRRRVPMDIFYTPKMTFRK